MTGINSAQVGAFMDALEELRNTHNLREPTVVSVAGEDGHGEDLTMTATYAEGAWLISMSGP